MYLLRLRLRDHMTTVLSSFAIRCNHFRIQLQLSELNATALKIPVCVKAHFPIAKSKPKPSAHIRGVKT